MLGLRDAFGDERWRGVFEAAADAGVVMVIGESDTGKTTLVTALANAALARGRAVGIIDADPGQSEIGPPTTIGVGRVLAPLGGPADAELIALEFVGATSPARNVLGAVVGVRRALDRARAARLDRIVVDTSGLVAGGLGRVLKQAKIDVLDPDLVVCLERAAECQAIVGPYLAGVRPRVLRMGVSPAVRARSAEERRRHREGRLRAHLASARPAAIDLARVVVRLPGGDVVAAPEALAQHGGALAGLENEARQTLGLAVVRGLDPAGTTLHVETTVDVARVAGVRIGRERHGG
ncbi:MAG: Clp1/GlmU family protein [Candidatus Rokuibacteriota bacterium]